MSLSDHPDAQALLDDAVVTPDQVRGSQDRLTSSLERYLPHFYRADTWAARHTPAARVSRHSTISCDYALWRPAGPNRRLRWPDTVRLPPVRTPHVSAGTQRTCSASTRDARLPDIPVPAGPGPDW